MWPAASMFQVWQVLHCNGLLLRMLCVPYAYTRMAMELWCLVCRRGAESGPAPTSGPHTQDPLQVHSQNTAHSGGVTTLHQRSCPLVVTSGNDCTCTPGSSTGPKSDSLHLEADAVGVPHRVPIHSEDSHNSHSRSPSGSVCASTPRFVGSHSQSGVLGPGSSGRIRVEGSLALQEHDVHPLVAAEQHGVILIIPLD